MGCPAVRLSLLVMDRWHRVGQVHLLGSLADGLWDGRSCIGYI